MIPAKIRRLVNKIRYYDYMYYVRSCSVISDIEYDKLRKELSDLEEEYPQYILPESPNNYVGFSIDSSKKKVIHSIPMLSLKKAKNISDIVSFIEKHKDLVAEVKIDGVSLSLEYLDGILVSAATRGNGLEGEDVTHHIASILDIPLKINYLKPLIVRGEVFIKKSQAEKINMSSLVSKRNIASGILNKKKTEHSHLLNFFSYSVHGSFLSQIDTLEWLKENGFLTAPLYKNISSVVGFNDYMAEVLKLKEKIDWDADGVVLKVNNCQVYQSLGANLHHPLGALSLKFYSQQAFSTVKEIKWAIGRTGILTPVAIIDPVIISNTTISKVNLHNLKKMKEMGIDANTRILIEKAGDIVPNIISVENRQRVVEPQSCYSCGGALSTNDIDLICENTECPGIFFENLLFFCQKLSIKHLGESGLQELIQSGIVKSYLDVLRLDQFIRTPTSIAQKNWQKIINKLKKEKTPEKIFSAIPFYNINKKYIKKVFESIVNNQDLSFLPIQTLYNLQKQLQQPHIKELIEYIKYQNIVVF